MNATGIVMMVFSYAVVLGLTGFCFFRVLFTPEVTKKEHAPLDIDTRDKGRDS
jgi:hypothetical protein